MNFQRHLHTVFLVAILWVATIHAFVSSRPVGWIKQPLSMSRPTTRPLQAVAKSGGKMIVTEEMFTKNVLSKDIPRPVLVFFSAPWYVMLSLSLMVALNHECSATLSCAHMCT